MYTSKVIYEISSLEKQIPLFKYFLNIGEQFRNKLYLECPELKNQDVDDYVTSLYQHKEKELEDIKNISQTSWNRIEDSILKEFVKILQIEWYIDIIPGGISLIPFSTRDLKEKRFDVYYRKDIDSILKTTTHELFHFIYFDKWKDIFPNTTLEEMDYPNPAWALSEIALPIILNSSKVVDILGMKFSTYTMFENEVFDGEKIVEHIKGLYQNNNFEDFLKQSNEYLGIYYEWKNSNGV